MDQMKKIALVLIMSLWTTAVFAACTGASIPVAPQTGSPYNYSSPTNADGNCGNGPNQWYQGTSNNGIFGSLTTLMSTELNTLSTTVPAASTVINGTGIANNSNTNQARSGILIFTPGSTVTCTTAGANLAVWFLQSGDGTTFESTSTVPPRAPDAIIPLPTAAIGTSNYNSAGYAIVPALNFKILVLNNCGVTLAASGNLIKLVPLAGQN